MSLVDRVFAAIAGGEPYVPTYPPEFAVGDAVMAYIEGHQFRSTVIARRWDEDALDWQYTLAGLPDCEFGAHEVHAL